VKRGNSASAAGGGLWPPSGAGAVSSGPAKLSFVVARASGTIVVTVKGILDVVGCGLLESVLIDLIEGQGNLAVTVDLAQAVVEPNAFVLLLAAARRAHRYGATLNLAESQADAHVASPVG